MVVPIVIKEGTKLSLSDFIPDFIEELYQSLCLQFPWFSNFTQFFFMCLCIVFLSYLITRLILVIFNGKK